MLLKTPVRKCILHHAVPITSIPVQACGWQQQKKSSFKYVLNLKLFGSGQFPYCTSLLCCFLHHLLDQSEIMQAPATLSVSLLLIHICVGQKKRWMERVWRMWKYDTVSPVRKKRNMIRLWDFSKWMKEDWIFLMGAGIIAWLEGAKKLQDCPSYESLY